MNKYLMKFKVFLLSFIIFFVIPVFAPKLYAATYYVATNGSNTNPGTLAQPWQTIQYAFDTISGGDTVKIQEGTYNQAVRIRYTKSGTSGNPTIIEPADPGDNVIITTNTNSDRVFILESSYTILRNITLNGQVSTSTAATGEGQCIRVYPGFSGTTDQVGVELDNLTIQQCAGHGVDIGGKYTSTQLFSSAIFKNSSITSAALSNYNGEAGSSGWGSGLKISRGGKNITLENNVISDNWGEGVAITKGENVTFQDNTIFNNYSVNIYVDNSKDITVRRNFSYCEDGLGAILRNGGKASGIAIGEEYYDDLPLWGNQLTNIKIYNNIVYNCNRAFSWYGTDNGTGGLDNSLIANNTFYLIDNTPAAIYFNPQANDSIEFYNNIIRSNAGKVFMENGLGSYTFDYNYWVGSAPTVARAVGVNDINNSEANLFFTSSPSFTDTTYQIGTSSLAKNEGVDLSEDGITTDYFSQLRDATPDIGAHEFGSSAGNLITGLTEESSFSIVNSINDESLESGAGALGSNITARFKTESENYVIADIEVDLTSSRTWSGISANVDFAQRKSFIHNLTSQPGTSSNYILYIPRGLSDSKVIICPGAQNFAQISISCPNAVEFSNGETNDVMGNPVSVTSVTIGGRTYWAANGVSGTGGVSIGSNMRVVLRDSEAPSAVSDVEIWFGGIAVEANSAIKLFYEDDFTGGSALTMADITVTCDADGLDPITGTGLTSISLVSSENGYLELDTNTDVCSSFIVIDINGTGGNSLTNPSQPGNYSWSIVVDNGYDDIVDAQGATLSYVANENDINVTAYVPPILDLELYEINSNTLLNGTGANTCALGVLSINTVSTCSYDIGTGTNNLSGVSVTISSDGPLDDGAGNTINACSGTNCNGLGSAGVSAGEEEYGIYISELGSGEYTAANSFGTQHQAVPTVDTVFATSNSTGSGTTAGSILQRLEVVHAASISTATNQGSYSHIVTFRAYTN